MNFLPGLVCGPAATGSPLSALAAAWEVRCKVAPEVPAGTLGALPTWATGTKLASEAQWLPTQPVRA